MTASAARVLYVGHSTVLVEMDGVRLLTDPLLGGRVLHLRRIAPVDRRSLEGLDAVLVSHVHLDHLHLPSLRRLGRETPVVVPPGVGRLLRRKGFTEVSELAVGAELRIGALVVRGVPAVHDDRRRPFRLRADPMGHLIRGTRSVYFAGDTDLFPEMAGLAPVDVALLPIWGWGPSLGSGGHMDPGEAADAARLLRASVAIPIHWGTYFPIHSALRGLPSFLRSPPEEFQERLAAVAPEIDVRRLQPGEETVV
jgi:L-ascorbate metabolism protein UlaG (beta-lactamase superfamily)